MQKYNCLIVEDEPIAAEIIEDYITQVPFLKLVAKCEDAMDAMEVIRSEKIDLIFLDIHLPRLKGLDFLKSLKTPPRVIVTTAYQDYAVQGYELNVIDYLLKPVEFNRFLMAVNKLEQDTQTLSTPAGHVTMGERPHLFFNVTRKKVRVFLDEILYIESIREYIKIATSNRAIVTKFALTEVEALLDKNDFLRIHRSFIVAKNKIDAFSATDVEIGQKQIPIGRSYREIVIAALEGKKG